ncbi:MAG: 2-hydroxyacyl-CoA dehydratase family protein [Armatimonadetes bacterium]|nr:2-hydroxyacyl-CoA dehydratase family protein [Armatimonadota bacterium]
MSRLGQVLWPADYGLPDLSAPQFIGLTTTVPVEVIFAAGLVPVDLNNVFISSQRPQALVAAAELAGYPRNVCGWIRGLYATALACGIRRIVAVTQGDCSQTHAMMETWEEHGIEVIPFAFPYDRDPQLLRAQIERFAERLGTTLEAAEKVRESLIPLRHRIAYLDLLTWREHKVSGYENHLWQVRCSDFGGDPARFSAQLEDFLSGAEAREPNPPRLRLGFMGVPPILSDLYSFLDGLGARVVFNETQRQFTMVDSVHCDLVGQYLAYTYPYSVFFRLEDIRRNVTLRGLDGVIHYVQSFCFRQIQDSIIRRGLSVPVLTLEGDAPGPLDARTKLRIEAFTESLLLARTQGKNL